MTMFNLGDFLIIYKDSFTIEEYEEVKKYLKKKGFELFIMEAVVES